MKLDNFDFDLPDRFIAQTALTNKEEAKLLVFNVNSKERHDYQIKDLLSILTSNDVLVFNKSKVIPARILINNKAEIFLSKIIEQDDQSITWECLVKQGKKFKLGDILALADDLQAEIIEVTQHGTRMIKFDANTEEFFNWLDINGQIPQPPYIKKEIKEKDYQTVFAKEGRSVAAPTAGLHFTENIFKKLKKKGVNIYFTHLDVGLGTFMPVKTDNILEHDMHSEYYHLDPDTAKKLNKEKSLGKRIIAVGTTSIRVLETCSNEKGELLPQAGETDIFIYPGYKFKFIDAMFTNFHTPKSTLLMLVSAFAGRDNILELYEHAKNNDYRFFSLGDATLLMKN